VLITAGDGTVTGLKMWNKNCTPTTYLWVIWWFMCWDSELLWECEDKYRSGAKSVWQKLNKQSDNRLTLPVDWQPWCGYKQNQWYVFSYQQSLSFIMHIKSLKRAILQDCNRYTGQVDKCDHITNIFQFTSVNMLHIVVGNYSWRMWWGN
jgi:hypothetical protein